jgi:phosphoribosylformimino-5-aminoimidazole carboxamide ribotide isomerase
MVDAGSHLPEEALTILSCGVREVVVGLETLHAFADLRNIVTQVGSSRVVFSLDLRLGIPILHSSMEGSCESNPLDLAGDAAEAGVSTILVLDLGRVGTGVGVDLGLIEALRKHLPDTRLLAGGGIHSGRDLTRLSDAGGDGALVASAIHDGRLSGADLAAVSRLSRPRDQSGTRASR